MPITFINERTAYTVDIRKPELMVTESNLKTTQRSSSWTEAHKGICDEEADCPSSNAGST